MFAQWIKRILMGGLSSLILSGCGVMAAGKSAPNSIPATFSTSTSMHKSHPTWPGYSRPPVVFRLHLGSRHQSKSWANFFVTTATQNANKTLDEGILGQRGATKAGNFGNGLGVPSKASRLLAANGLATFVKPTQFLWVGGTRPTTFKYFVFVKTAVPSQDWRVVQMSYSRKSHAVRLVKIYKPTS